MTDPRQEVPLGKFPDFTADDWRHSSPLSWHKSSGIDAYNPDAVPPATDAPPQWDVTQTEEYQEERAEIRREFDKDELQIEGQRDSIPPTRYDN